MKKNKILLAEPSELIAQGFCSLFRDDASFAVCGCITGAEELRDALLRFRPDALIVNPMLFAVSTSYSITTLQKEFPELAVVALSYQYLNPIWLKPYTAVIDICDSKSQIENKLLQILTDKSSVLQEDNYELSQREKDVLVLIAKGMMNKEIADQLNLSVHTVITHRKNITRKTDIKSVAGLTVYALLNNLISEDEIL